MAAQVLKRSFWYWDKCDGDDKKAEDDEEEEDAEEEQEPITTHKGKKQQKHSRSGVAVLLGWMLSERKHLASFTRLYKSMGWDCLVCHPHVLNLFFPSMASSLALSILVELVKELERHPCPIVFITFSGGHKACLYKIIQSSRLADSGVDSSDSFAENNSKVDGSQQHASIASVLQKIVDRAGGKGPPLSAFLESVEYEASSILKQVLNYQVAVEPKPNSPFGNWVEHLELLAPIRQSEESKLAVQNILQILNENQDTQLQSIKTRLSVPDVVEVLKELENPTTAFVFYKWVRRQPFYIPHESIYAAVIEQLIASSELDSWDQLHVVMNGMIKKRVFIDNLLFRRILKVLCVYGLKHPYSIPRTQRYVGWLLRMSKAGFVSWLSTCKIVMKRCNILGMYESTLSVFEGIPMNAHTSTLTVALFACKGLNNLNLAEELVNKMKRKKVEPNAKCLSILVRLCADHGQADKAERYSEQMKELDFSVDERGE